MLLPWDPSLDELWHGLPQSAGCDDFREDILALIRLYADVSGASRLNLKLESFGSNLCERFHVDWVPLRLICSYAGPGTEWLDNHNVNRARLGPLENDLSDEASGLLLPGARINRLDPYNMGLMKGELWPGNHGRGLVHRSPPHLGKRYSARAAHNRGGRSGQGHSRFRLLS